ncbi:MAG: hypothetical protein QG646_227, partial [Euryarchaeota archaeon]|nr:hypothetical protein [Euryarchaeota archaeon]
GLLAIGSITFERVRVRGLQRSPSPAARIIAFIKLNNLFEFIPYIWKYQQMKFTVNICRMLYLLGTTNNKKLSFQNKEDKFI